MKPRQFQSYHNLQADSNVSSPAPDPKIFAQQLNLTGFKEKEDYFQKKNPFHLILLPTFPGFNFTRKCFPSHQSPNEIETFTVGVN